MPSTETERAGQSTPDAFLAESIAACWRVEGRKGDAMRLESYIKRRSRSDKLRFTESPVILTILAESDIAVCAEPVFLFYMSLAALNIEQTLRLVLPGNPFIIVVVYKHKPRQFLSGARYYVVPAAPGLIRGNESEITSA